MSDSDSVGLELPKLDALESERCGLNLEPRERRSQDGEWWGEYDGLRDV